MKIFNDIQKNAEKIKNLMSTSLITLDSGIDYNLDNTDKTFKNELQ